MYKELNEIIKDESFQHWLSGSASCSDLNEWDEWSQRSSYNQKLQEEAKKLRQASKFQSLQHPNIEKEWQRLLRRINRPEKPQEKFSFQSNLSLKRGHRAATLASSTIGGSSEDRFNASVESTDGLVPGANVIAVEVHQRSLGSSDVSFDFRLEAIVDMPTGILNGQENVPQEFVLFAPYPNPFNPETTISLAIPKTVLVDVKVYNSRQQLIRTLVDAEVLTQGMYRYVWDSPALQ